MSLFNSYLMGDEKVIEVQFFFVLIDAKKVTEVKFNIKN